MNYGRAGIRQRQRALNSASTRMGKSIAIIIFEIVVFCTVALGVVGLCGGIGLFMGVIDTAPDVTNVDVSPAGFSTTVYDNKGNTLTKLIAENSNRIYVTLDKIPEHTQHAFVAIEDERFYTHNGIDIQGIMRAGVKAILDGDFSQGASTITQQLLKNNVFTSWTSESSKIEKFKRKFQEQYCAIQLEKNMDKETILENYLNTINLGQGTLGVQAASNRYFGKPAAELTISESAVIAAITQNPSRWNPITHPDNNAGRREEVLRKMRDQGYITPAEFDEALADDVYSRIKNVNEETEKNTIYTYFVDELTDQVLSDLQEIKGYSYTQAYNALYSGGLSIFTTQDRELQKICDEEFANPENYPENIKWLLTCELTYEDANGELVNFSKENFEKHFKQEDPTFNMIFNSQEEAEAKIEEYKAFVEEPGYTFVAETKSITPQPQASMTLMDHHTGEVKAIVGGRGTKAASLTLNRATNTKRQPGSCFKVLAAYAPALDSAGFTLASTQVDEPFTYANGRPVSNWYDTGYKGICTVRYGIEQSLNIVAVKTLTDIGPQLGFDYLQNFGFTTLVERRTEWDGSISSDITQALALGGVTDGVTNLEITAAYATIANGGTYTKPVFYTKVLDHDGNVLLENQPQTRQVIKETTAYLLTSAMVDVVTKGTGGRVNFGGMSIAGKTGTTSKDVDVWFCGFTPYYTCGAWAGYDNNVHMGKSETSIAKSLWRACMSRIHENLEYKEFTRPEGITSATVCSKSGKLAVAGLCDVDGSAHSEIFSVDNVPSSTCDMHMVGTICTATGLRASDTCPYCAPGVIYADATGDPYASTPYCVHSYMNGIPLFAIPDGMTINDFVDAASAALTVDPNAVLPE
ncbi:MAG: PBP1A family penicillin-binding protein [Lachnospiraceae bacterium]|nr:PBP1A family penicillin-binding protein [Lachnospiraceae bacterium]